MIDFTGYHPVKWTLDFHQFLIKNFKSIYQELLTHNDFSDFYIARDADMREIILDEILRHLLANNLQLNTLNKSVYQNTKHSILVAEFKAWSKGKKNFYFKKNCFGKKTNPEDLKIMFQKDWEFLFLYFTEGFPIKDEFKSVFYDYPNAENQLQQINEKIDILVRGVLSARELAEVFKDVDPVYYEELINSDEYYTDLTGKEFVEMANNEQA